MELENYDKYVLLLILASACISIVSHFYDYAFYKGGFVVNGWSRTFDVPEHLIYTIELLRGRWPFQNPMAAGFPINYPIGLPLLVAVFVRITATPVLQAFRFFSIALIIFVGLSSYIMVSRLLNNKRIGFYTTFFILFSAGYGWVTTLFPVFGLSRSSDFFLYYFCMIDTFYYYPTLISVNLFRPLSRTFGFGLFCFYLYFLNSFRTSNKTKYAILNGVLFAILLNTSPAMAIELFILSLVTLVYFKNSVSDVLRYFSLLVLIISPFFIQLLFNLTTGVLITKTNEGSLTSLLSSTEFRYLSPLFYVSLFGIAFVFMVVGVLFHQLKEKHLRNFLFLWLVIALVLANLPLAGLAFQTLNFTLLLNIPFYIFSSLGVIKLLDLKLDFTITSYFSIDALKQYIVLLLVLACSLSILRMVYINGYAVNDLPTGMTVYTVDTQEYTALMWVRDTTETDAIFLTFHSIDLDASRVNEKLVEMGRGYSWVATLGERRVLLNKQAEFLFRGMDYNEVLRIALDIDFIYTIKDVQKTVQLIKSYPISYIYVGSDERTHYGNAVNKFENQNYFERVYFNDLVKIYRLKSITPP